MNFSRTYITRTSQSFDSSVCKFEFTPKLGNFHTFCLALADNGNVLTRRIKNHQILQRKATLNNLELEIKEKKKRSNFKSLLFRSTMFS